MPGENVSREELKAMVEVQSKNVEQLTIIANHLANIVDRENKIYERLYNGMAKEIASTVITHVQTLRDLVEETKDCQAEQCAAAKETIAEVIEEKLSNSTIAKDIGHVKWFVGIVGVAIIVASVVLNGMFRKNDDDNYMKKLQTVIESYASEVVDYKNHMATNHEAQTK